VWRTKPAASGKNISGSEVKFKCRLCFPFLNCSWRIFQYASLSDEKCKFNISVGIRSSVIDHMPQKGTVSRNTLSLYLIERKEELMTRDGTVSDKAQLLKDEMETINREQEKLISRDKEVHRSSK
jgi:hypothetical protein